MPRAHIGRIFTLSDPSKPRTGQAYAAGDSGELNSVAAFHVGRVLLGLAPAVREQPAGGELAGLRSHFTSHPGHLRTVRAQSAANAVKSSGVAGCRRAGCA